jgi:hypothetical protein|tara:strand:- start:207 stop:587 length:381 start_codon:yes stop_codon:yes gene_type:complete
MKYKPLCNCLYVDQSQIVVSRKKLYTSHVGTCSILLFSYNKLNFMAHIDALQNNNIEITKKILKYFNTQNIHNVFIYKGNWCFTDCLSTNTIITSLNNLNISYKIYEKKIKWNNYIYIDNNIITIS